MYLYIWVLAFSLYWIFLGYRWAEHELGLSKGCHDTALAAELPIWCFAVYLILGFVLLATTIFAECLRGRRTPLAAAALGGYHTAEFAYTEVAPQAEMMQDGGEVCLDV